MGLFGVILGMVIVAAAAVFGLQQYDELQIDLNANETRALVTQVAGDVQAAYRTQAGYGAAGTALTATVIGLEIIPPDYRITAATAESPFNQPFTVVGQAAEFDVVVADLDDDECVAVMQRSWRRGELRTIAVASVAAENPNTISPADVVAGCVDGDGANDLTFRFR